jgi:hypothetical protein
MARLRGLSRSSRLLLAVAVGAATFGIATAVQASIPDSNAIVHSCYNTSLAHGDPVGAMRAIDTAKAGTAGTCTGWEGGADLATPTYVQNQIQNAVQGLLHTQFIYTDPTPISFNGTGIAYISWYCGDGWVATNATVSIKTGQPQNTIVQVDGANTGSVNNSPTNPFGADGGWLMHINYMQANVQFYAQLQCVQAKLVYGNAYGAAGTRGGAATPKPVMHVTFTPST